MDVQCRPGCGACCDPVCLPYTQNEVRAQAAQFDPEELRWILDDLVPMSRREAKAKYPQVFERPTMGMANGHPVYGQPMFYSCRNLDPESRQCRIYGQRPQACRQFPWYGAGPNADAALPAACEFNRDVGREPVPVTLTTKP